MILEHRAPFPEYKQMMTNILQHDSLAVMSKLTFKVLGGDFYGLAKRAKCKLLCISEQATAVWAFPYIRFAH